MPGITSILNIGKMALFGSQAAVQTTGNNIANVNTPGYSRRSVVFEESYSLDYNPGQIGTGVIASEVIRHFDEFIEVEYNDKAAQRDRYYTLWNNLKGVDSLLDESGTEGVNAALNQFFQDWSDLALRPEDLASREALTARTQNMITLLGNTDSDLHEMQQEAEDYARREVDEVNQLIKQIGEINLQIAIHDIPGENNANALMDKRDQAVRELAERMDIVTVLKGETYTIAGQRSIANDFMVLTKAGHTLVQGKETFSLSFQGPRTITSLSMGTTFDGNINFSGTDAYEYTVEVVQGGQVSNATAGTTAMYRVSLDGGMTWLTDENGAEKHFYARPYDGRTSVGDLEIWFENNTQDLSVGDRFDIIPKNGIYWHETTSKELNITPMIRADGSDNPRRLTGGSLCGYMNFAQYYTGGYRDQLDAVVKSLIWEVNKVHSQGAGLSFESDILGTYSVRDETIALGSDTSGLAFSDRLASGNMSVYFYDSASGELVSAASFGPLDFGAGAGLQNFDPTQHSLSDVAAAFNRSYGGFVTASITNNQLHLVTATGVEMGFGADSTGLLAGLGINTFFTGEGVGDLGLNIKIAASSDRINAGHINGAGEANLGDNATANAMAALATQDVTITSSFESSGSQSIVEYYSSLVSRVGGDTANAEFTFEYNNALAQDLNERQEAVAGVNLDEEMSNLIKFQASYRAAAKLITTADEMLQTVLGLKQ